ncbi:hypothetical protein CQZ76_05240 [Anaplasma marginale]|nr:hypothetical protein CQZ76_05240 [Anaplasma marginale]
MSAMRSDRFSGAHVVAHAPLSPKELCHRVGRVAIWLCAQKADSARLGACGQLYMVQAPQAERGE